MSDDLVGPLVIGFTAEQVSPRGAFGLSFLVVALAHVARLMW